MSFDITITIIIWISEITSKVTTTLWFPRRYVSLSPRQTKEAAHVAWSERPIMPKKPQSCSCLRCNFGDPDYYVDSDTKVFWGLNLFQYLMVKCI